MDSPGHRHVRDNGAHCSLLRVGRCSGSGGSRCTRSAMKLLSGLRVSSSPSGRSEDLGLLRHLPPSDALLARPEVVPGGPGSPGHGRSLPSGHTGSDRPHIGPSSRIFLYLFGGLSEAQMTRCLGRLLPPHFRQLVPLYSSSVRLCLALVQGLFQLI